VEARKRWRRPHPSQEEVEEARSEPSAIRTVIKNRSLPPPPRHTHTHAGMHIYRIPATSSADRRFPHYRDIGRRGHARHKRSSRVQQRGFLPALRNVCQVWQSESENVAFKGSKGSKPFNAQRSTHACGSTTLPQISILDALYRNSRMSFHFVRLV
jgi:hypothetical protein